MRRLAKEAGRVAGVAALLLLAGDARTVQAFGTPTYIIYVDGPNGGTIETSGGAPTLPDGACGMRLTNANVLAWYWAEGEVFPTGELNVENNGWMPPANQLLWLIEFTGPFGGDCDGEYVFHTPATPDSEPPPGAIALVVQFVEPDDVEFLTGNFHVWEPPEPPEPEEPPDPDDICEEVPEFCEIPDSLVENPCYLDIWGELCDDAEDLGALGFGVARIVEPPILGLSALAGTPADDPILRRALDRVATAAEFDPQIKKARKSLVARANTRLRSREAQHWLARAGVAADLGARDLQQCRADLELALRSSTSPLGRERAANLAPSRRAKAACDAAAATLQDAHVASTRFTIGLRRER